MAKADVTAKQLHDMQHALGLDEFGQGTWYRNHFVAGPGCDGWEELNDLVARGFMTRRDPNELYGGDYCFIVTDLGKDYVRNNSPKPPKLSRAKERYRRWLRSGADMSFGEWLQVKRG